MLTQSNVALQLIRMGAGDPAVPSMDIAISGAGTAGYIDALTQQLIATFQRHHPPKSGMSLDDALETTVREFYKNNVIPFACYPAHERPDVSMLIAYQRGGVRRILKSENTTLVETGGYATVGAGAFFANTILSRIWQGPYDLRATQLLAAYVISNVKDRIDGCGKNTVIEVIPTHSACAVGFQIEDRRSRQSVSRLF